MAAIDAPTYLQCFLPGTLNDGLVDTKVQDRGEVGAARLRNRFTRALRLFQFETTLTDAQKTALETFYITTLSRGVSAFNWTHPVSGVAYEVILPTLPKLTRAMHGYWSASVDLEEI